MRDPKLERAYGYPYWWPDTSYCLRCGQVEAFSEDARYGRIPVLAVGSNRAPVQLVRKFGPDAFVPVEKVELIGYDVVYGARLSRYGAVPATTLRMPGVMVTVALNWLTAEQVAVMHDTEGVGRSYDVVSYDWESFSRRQAGPEPVGYVACAGALCLDGQVYALEDVSAIGRSLQSLTSPEILNRVSSYLDAGLKTLDFVANVQNDAEYRRSCLSRLRAVGVKR